MTRYEQYRTLVQQEKNLVVVGRLGQYAYFDMDKAIAAALSCFENQIASEVAAV